MAIEQFFTCYVPKAQLILASMTQEDFSTGIEKHEQSWGLADQFFNPKFVDWYLNKWEDNWKLKTVFSRLDWQKRVQIELVRD